LSNCVFSTSPSSWTNTSLEAVFTRTYTSPIATYYPYNATNITTTTIPTPDSGGGGFPSWAGAVIGVVVGVLLLVGAFAFWFLRRRRKRGGSGGRRHSEASRGSRVMQWVHAGAFSPPNAKDADGEETTTVSGGFTNDETVAPSVTTAGATGATGMTVTAEAGSEPVYEMQGMYHPSLLSFSDTVVWCGVRGIKTLLSVGTSRGYAVELPTAYNENPLAAPSPASAAASSPARSPSPATTPGAIGYISPVSPEVPQEKEADVPASATTAAAGTATATRPGHTRNVSSLSSMQSYSTQLVEIDGSMSGGGARPRYESGVSEASISSAGTRIGEDSSVIGSGIGSASGVRRENRGLGLEDIPDSEAER
jgi:hypothetical protein